VFQQAWEALKEGGELYFSDIYSDRRVPEEVQKDSYLWNEGYGGSLYIEDFRRIMNQIGFKHLSMTNVSRYDEEESKKLNQKYFSITFRAFKISSLEDKDEDYQIEATYKGGIPDYEEEFEFDINYTFVKDQPISVSRNMAEILRHSRYAKHFEVTEEGPHQGLFQKQSCCKLPK
jgi:arsenite methyltransferase